MDNEPDTVRFTADQMIQFVTGVLEQQRLHDRPDSSSLKPGNELTLSMFSELRYALGSRNLSSIGPLVQTLPAKINACGELEFGKVLPHYAHKAILIRRSGAREAHSVTGGTQPVIDDLRDPHEFIAVQIQDRDQNIRAITFVTHEPRSPRGCESTAHDDATSAK